MRAAVCTRYGQPEVMKYIEVEKPMLKKNQVRIKVECASVSSGDARMRSMDIPKWMKPIYRLIIGIKRPRKAILGSQYAGIVDSVGDLVSKFKVGDEVFGITGMQFGCYAEYICVKENSVISKKPSNISFEQTVPISFGAMTALHILRTGKIKAGEEVLIYGASGSVGTYAIQIAKALGAKVIAVCSEHNHELVKSLGADEVIDYHVKDFRTASKKYDVIFDAVGKIKKKECLNVLTINGRYLSVEKMTTETLEKLDYLKQMVEEKRLITVIDRVYSLSDIVEAHRYVDSGHKKGNVILKI